MRKSTKTPWHPVRRSPDGARQERGRPERHERGVWGVKARARAEQSAICRGGRQFWYPTPRRLRTKRAEQRPQSELEERESHAADTPSPRPTELRHEYWRPSRPPPAARADEAPETGLPSLVGLMTFEVLGASLTAALRIFSDIPLHLECVVLLRGVAASSTSSPPTRGVLKAR